MEDGVGFFDQDAGIMGRVLCHEALEVGVGWVTGAGYAEEDRRSLEGVRLLEGRGEAVVPAVFPAFDGADDVDVGDFIFGKFGRYGFWWWASEVAEARVVCSSDGLLLS